MTCFVAKWKNSDGCLRPTASAISRVDVPKYPRTAKSWAAATRMRSRVMAPPEVRWSVWDCGDFVFTPFRLPARRGACPRVGCPLSDISVNLS